MEELKKLEKYSINKKQTEIEEIEELIADIKDTFNQCQNIIHKMNAKVAEVERKRIEFENKSFFQLLFCK